MVKNVDAFKDAVMTTDGPEAVQLQSLSAPALAWDDQGRFLLYNGRCLLSHAELVSRWDPEQARWVQTVDEYQGYEAVFPHDPAWRKPPARCYVPDELRPPPKDADLAKTQLAFSCRTTSRTDKYAGGVRRSRPTSGMLAVEGYPYDDDGDVSFFAEATQKGFTLKASFGGSSRPLAEQRFTWPQLLAFLLGPRPPACERARGARGGEQLDEEG